MSGHAETSKAKDIVKIGGVLAIIFFATFAANLLFAKELLYNWQINRHNAQSVQNIQPGE